MITEWGKPHARLERPAPPAYAATLTGDAARGEQAFNTFCASCHGAGGTGKGQTGPIVDPAYLALVNDQYLRSNILAGKPESGMPDWSSAYGLAARSRVMTDAEVTDIVAWIASHRVAPRPASLTSSTRSRNGERRNMSARKNRLMQS